MTACSQYTFCLRVFLLVIERVYFRPTPWVRRNASRRLLHVLLRETTFIIFILYFFRTERSGARSR